MTNVLSEIRALGTKYAGPVLTNYVKWILLKASERGIKRIYFLARDGYTLKMIAEEICGRCGLDIDCRYLYCSRFSLRLPSFHLIGGEAMDMLLIPAVKNTVRGVFRRLCATEEEERQIMDTIDFPCGDPCEPLSYEQYDGLCAALRASSAFSELVRRKSEQAYGDAVGYLEQEGLLSDIPYAIADSGWTGSMQRSLRQLLSRAGYTKKLTGFYFGMFADPKSEADGEYNAMYFNAHSPKRDRILFSNNLFECWLSAPHAMTKGYTRENGRFVPVFDTEPSEQECALINAHIDGITNYVRHCADSRLDPRRADEKELVGNIRKILRRIMAHPTSEEAQVYGQYMFSDDVSSEGMKPLASPEQVSRLKNYVVPRRVINKVFGVNRLSGAADLFWAYGTLAFAPPIKRGWYFLNIYVWEWIKAARKK
ncbi:MAG: hypothetical protein ACI4XA_09310 [Oscillospiraceae bacterium]